MNYTESQLERLADTFRSYGYDSEEIMDNETWAKLADCVLNGLGLVIKDKEDHLEQLAVLSSLMDNKIEKDSFQSNYLQLLALVLDDYENKHYNILGEPL